MNKKISDFFKSFWGGLVIALVIVGIGYLVYNFLNQGGVDFRVIGPQEAKSGELKNIQCQIFNNSQTPLVDTELIVNLPEGVFNPEDPSARKMTISLGEIAAKTEEDRSFSLLFTGENNTLQQVEVVFHYRPQSVSALFEKRDLAKVLIYDSIFRLNVQNPSQIFIDQNFPITVSWSNMSDYPFENVELRAEWPSNFTLSESNPQTSFSSNNRWSLGALMSGGQGKVNLKGYISGQAGETLKVIFNLGIVQGDQFFPLAKAEGVFTLVENPLRVYTLVNGGTSYEADLGEELNVKIYYQNNYSSALRNLKLVVNLNGEAFDFTTLKAPKGVFASNLHQITWDGLYVPELYNLNPHEDGSLEFTVKLKKNWPMVRLDQQNPVLEIKTTIESSNLPENTDLSELPKSSFVSTVKINTVTDLIVESYFRDPTAPIANTGNLPLRVNQPTDFTIHWKIKNTYNALNNVVVQTTLPYWVEFTSQVAGNYGPSRPEYDSLTKTVTWSIPIVEAGSGILDKGYEAVFQVRVTPVANYTNQAIPIIGETSLRAIDAFTGKAIEKIISPVMSNQLTDKTVFSDQGIVKP